jgi:guanylate kinase
MGKIFYLLGKSASGKDSIYHELMEQNMGLKPVVPYTTRPMREGETEGTEYHFISDDDFFSLKAQGKLIEYREYETMHGIWRYMTVNDGQIDLDKDSYLMIGTLESYEKTRACFGGAVMVPIYLTLDDGERMMRALKRERQQKEPKYAELCRRFLADEADFTPDRLRECGIEKTFSNDDFTQCTKEITDYIREQLGL